MGSGGLEVKPLWDGSFPHYASILAPIYISKCFVQKVLWKYRWNFRLMGQVSVTVQFCPSVKWIERSVFENATLIFENVQLEYHSTGMLFYVNKACFSFFFFFVGGKVLWKSLLLSGEVNFILNLKTRRLKMLKQFLVIGKRFNIVRFIDITCSVWKFKFFFFFLEGSIFRWITYLDFSLLCFMPNVKDEVANISRVGNRLPTGVGGKSGVSCERNFWLHLWDECMCEMISGPSSVICNCVCICF